MWIFYLCVCVHVCVNVCVYLDAGSCAHMCTFLWQAEEKLWVPWSTLFWLLFYESVSLIVLGLLTWARVADQ